MFTKKRLLGITLIVVLILVLVQPIFSQTNIVDLGTLGCCGRSASSINDLSQVVGTSGTPDGFMHAFLWSAKTGMQDLGTLGGNYSSASSINDRGQVVGFSITAAGDYHAFQWTAKGGMEDLGTLGGTFTSASFINQRGQVVGESDTVDGYPISAASTSRTRFGAKRRMAPVLFSGAWAPSTTRVRGQALVICSWPDGSLHTFSGPAARLREFKEMKEGTASSTWPSRGSLLHAAPCPGHVVPHPPRSPQARAELFR